MKIFNLAAVASACIALAGCQPAAPEGTHWEWVQIAPGDRLDVATAKCQIASAGVEQGMYAYGSAGYVAGAQIGNAIGNAIRVQQFMERCLLISGWKRIAVANPTPPAVRPQIAPPPPTSAKRLARG